MQRSYARYGEGPANGLGRVGCSRGRSPILGELIRGRCWATVADQMAARSWAMTAATARRRRSAWSPCVAWRAGRRGCPPRAPCQRQASGRGRGSSQPLALPNRLLSRPPRASTPAGRYGLDCRPPKPSTPNPSAATAVGVQLCVCGRPRHHQPASRHERGGHAHRLLRRLRNGVLHAARPVDHRGPDPPCRVARQKTGSSSRRSGCSGGGEPDARAWRKFTGA
jgi:hypothetical protein